jgi:DNA-binding HxlR family transcriptional regulator
MAVRPDSSARPHPAAIDPTATATATEIAAGDGCGCCPQLHEAVELIGRRWSGAIIEVLRLDGPLRFSELVQAIPGLSDRLCSERVKELEARGVVERTVHPGPPVRVEYALTPMGRGLGPALVALQAWAHHWLAGDCEDPGPARDPRGRSL